MKTHKICNICNLVKPIEDFYKNSTGSPAYACKPCTNYISSSARTPEKKAKKAAYDKEYRRRNRAKLDQQIKEWRAKHKGDESLLTFNKERKREIKRRVERKARANNPLYNLVSGLRSRLNQALTKKAKAGSAIRDVGCSREELMRYLESKFYNHPITGEPMTWQNRGRFGWHIDHIIPLSSFDLSDRTQFLKACHYTNLQPLWQCDHNAKTVKENRKS